MTGRRLAAAALLAAVMTADVASAANDTEADWILLSQLPDGAIAQYPDFTRINPYLANYAAMGLVRAWITTGNATYVDAAERWFDWYEGHADADGVVTDYDLGPAPDYAETSTGDEDSTDGYAGTLLLALDQLRQQGADGKGRLRNHAALVAKAVSAILLTQDADGLTWAKPAYHAKYLMDQAEAFAGLVAGGRLGGIVHDPATAKRAKAAARAMKTGVAARMWNAAASLYEYAIPSGRPTSWGFFYPDATSEAWAVAVGDFLSPARLIPPAKARSLMATFVATWPQWTDPTAVVAFDSGPNAANYWPLIGGALVAVGHKADGVAATRLIEAAADGASRAYPFVVASAGQIVLVTERR